MLDGAFSSAREWLPESRMEGVLTDVYFDYEAPTLYVLNDWRANSEGISPDCYNFFGLRIGERQVGLRVYGDGRVEVEGTGLPVRGAYGRGPSPLFPDPHTIFEFSLNVPNGQTDVCCADPVSMSNCQELTSEPVVFSIHTSDGPPRVQRTVPPTVSRLAEARDCGRGEGLCADGLSCSSLDRDRPVCVPVSATMEDAGTDAAVDAGGDAGPLAPPD